MYIHVRYGPDVSGGWSSLQQRMFRSLVEPSTTDASFTGRAHNHKY
jgi:hypothetical protein